MGKKLSAKNQKFKETNQYIFIVFLCFSATCACYCFTFADTL